MISESSIQNVLSAARIEEVVGKFIDLKKAGSNWKAKSPFTDEKTPSFMVSPAKNIFKCFSSGVGGGPVSFLQEHKQMTFPEAMEWLADLYNIRLEKTDDKRTEEDRDRLSDLDKCQRAVLRNYQQQLWSGEGLKAREYLLHKRGYTEDTLVQWGVGYAPDEWRFITDKVIDKGYFQLCADLGICGHKNDRNYDRLRNRVVFPIYDHAGRLVGLGARTLETDNKEVPKYLNSPESDIYHKGRVLYGLNFAAAAIKKAGFAYLVEGYTDVISMHQGGVENTVAACGTGITPAQIQLLGRYCNHIVMLTDGDTAGLRAAEKGIILALKAGMKADIVCLEEGEDPDTLARSLQSEELSHS